MKACFILIALLVSANGYAAVEDASAIIPQALDEKIETVDEQADQIMEEAVATAVPAQVHVSEPIPVPVPEVAATKPLKEADIPVLATVNSKKAESKNPFARLIISLVVMALLSGGLIFFSRWYSKNNKKTADNNKIRILNQHFLGPRKSLAIIRVAGESLLIGITDQNISMLKTLSLLDEEVPDTISNSFEKSMVKADQKAAAQDDDVDDFMIGNIKDKISSKLKNMRSI